MYIYLFLLLMNKKVITKAKFLARVTTNKDEKVNDREKRER